MDFRHHFRRLFTPGSAWAGRGPRRTSGVRRRMFMEPLESRQLMALTDSGIRDGEADHDVIAGFSANYYPPQHSKAGTFDFLTPVAAGDAASIGLGYLQENASFFGLGPTDFHHANMTNRNWDSSNGITSLYYQQTFNGLLVADAHIGVNVSGSGQVITAGASFVSNLSYPPVNTPLFPEITAGEALNVFGEAAGLSSLDPTDTLSQPEGRSQKTTLEDSDISLDPIPVQLQYVPAVGGGLDLAWQIIARTPDGDHWYDAAVAASGSRAGQVIRVADWAFNASYDVFAVPLKDPAEGGRTTVVDPQDFATSPFGWHDTNGLVGAEFFDTQGNNVRVQDDLDGDDMGGTRPSGGAGLNFNAPFTFPAPPLTNLDAAITQVFYAVNVAHDVIAHYGFNEASGNFQERNYSGQGLAADPVIADVQDPGLVNNASMLTPPDGLSPRMQIGVSTVFTPNRDIAFDNVTTFHEFYHGVSNRLTGGPANANALQALQSAGMGEGWSDWFGYTMSLKSTDNRNTPQTFGAWTDGPGGIRRFPYSFDFAINPLTLANYNGDMFPQQNNTEIHNSGEIWASALMDMTWLLIERYGFSTNLYTGTGGNNEALQLVTQALKLQPVVPTFFQARDAIISADLVLNGGANFELIWQAFARRGFGFSASTSDSNSLVVIPAFDVPASPARVSGRIFNDVDGDARRDTGEPFMSGITVYNDANNNRVLDGFEPRTVSGSNGVYSLAFISTQTVNIRQVLPATFVQISPPNNGAHTFVVQAGVSVGGKDFANQAARGRIAGIKYNDLNGNGSFEEGEPLLRNVFIFVDVNGDGKLNLLEPAATTDFFGRYLLKDVPAGSNHIVREIVPPGGTQTQPGPLGSPAAPALGAIEFAHTSVVVLPNQTTFGINFGNTIAEDFGDAPDSYGTSLATNGPRHGVLANFGFGAARDAEMNGFPSATALGDDLNNSDDEDGVVFAGLTPGATATVTVTVNSGSNSPGKVHGWIDFDQDGVFEASERVVSNRILGSGTHTLPITIPANARLNETFARFRYGYEIDLGPKGASLAGEVEDYQVTILPARPVANNDEFGNPPNLIRQGTTDNPLDVLANDTRTARGLPQIVESEFPKTTSKGGSVRVGPVDPATGRKVLLYTPPSIFVEEAPLDDTFTYNVTDGFTTSIVPGVVTIHVSLGNPIALDDSYTVDPALNSEAGTADTVITLDVMDNDRFPLLETQVVSVINVTANPMTVATINAADPQQIDFRAPSGFRGTEIFRYTISDNDDTTLDSTALVTVQVVDDGLFAGPAELLAAGYLAELNIQVLDADGIVDVGETFQILVSSIDLRPPSGTENRGVEAAYLDVLIPLFSDAAGNKFPFADLVPNSIVYQPPGSPTYNTAQQAFFNSPAPGALNETGGAHTSGGASVGEGEVQVFTVTLRARQSTGGQPIQIVADPPEGLPGNTEASDVTVASLGGVAQVVHHFTNEPPVRPQVLKTFFRPSGDLVIMGEGEGMFVNRANSLDVDMDNQVTAGDALEVINHLNAWGALSLLGDIPLVTGMIDVDMDSTLSAGDALTVINYLNARGHRSVMSNVPAGGAEAEPQSDGGDASDSSSEIDATLTTMLEPSTTTTSTTTTSTTTTSTTENQVNPVAADNLYAEMEAAQEVLRKRYRR